MLTWRLSVATCDAFRAGINFGARVTNTLNEAIFRGDLDVLPFWQHLPSERTKERSAVNWTTALGTAKSIRDFGRHMILMAKCLASLEPEMLNRQAALRGEVAAFGQCIR